MATFPSPPQIAFAGAASEGLTAEVLILPVYEGDDLGDLTPVDLLANGALTRAISTGEFRGRPFETFITGTPGAVPRVMLVGAGTRADLTGERLRNVAAAAGRTAAERRLTRVAYRWRGDLDVAEALRVSAEGFILSGFDAGVYKTSEDGTTPLARLTLVVEEGASSAVVTAIERGVVTATSTNVARALCNEPANMLTPQEFAAQAASLGGAGLLVDVLDERQIADLGMGLLLAVARGSRQAPRVVVMSYTPEATDDGPTLGLVGKGITFDTGGISLKVADGMERMKGDMAGGAAVIGAMRAIAMLKPQIRVIGVVPMTENMPDGNAMRPGDVIRSASGATVEIINTDAEGRLILGDALWYARRLGATHLVDLATLTGSCVVALGRVASGLMGEPDAWVETVRAAAARAGDRCWPLPLFDEYADQLKSDIADIVNSGGRPAGAITAAKFLQRFAGDGPWAHLDIAGTAWLEEARPWQGKGPTGVGVRTLIELALAAPAWREQS